MALAVENWTVEGLPESTRAKYAKVLSEGAGVCSRCRWRPGCLSCDPAKAWSYYDFQSLGLEERDLSKGGDDPKKVKGGAPEIEACVTKHKKTFKKNRTYNQKPEAMAVTPVEALRTIVEAMAEGAMRGQGPDPE